MTENPEHLANIFGRLEDQPADALLALIGLFRNDPRPDKIDLGVGVYRDASGNTPVMRAVKKAERILVEEQPTKSYLAPEGDARFTDLLARIVFGATHELGDRLVGVQTPGGTGALRMAAELIARANGKATVWIGNPTWPNHVPIFEAAGLRVRMHPFFDIASQAIRFEAMLDALQAAEPGDILLLHGCCHNPTGAGFDIAQWEMLAKFAKNRGLLPIIDLAYQGLGEGLDADAYGTRLFIERLPNLLVAYSCDKNFGLYRERTGALWAKADNAANASRVRANMLSLARANWSMPPDHGAAIVRTILEHAELLTDWRDELEEMRRRIAQLRQVLADTDPRLGSLASQSGMFSSLQVSRQCVVQLREEHGIYMADSGRINIAGLSIDRVGDFAHALMPLLGHSEEIT